MLDEDGVIVAWYERARDIELGKAPIIDCHVSNLYVTADVMLGIPIRELCSATIHGSSAQQGWRRGSDGATFWGSTVIQSVRLRDGRLQGFSHVTREAAIPWREQEPKKFSLETEHWNTSSPPLR
jgi:two-component system CheB/CheR fusion protein